MRRDIRTEELTWLDVVDPTPEDIHFLAASFALHPHDVEPLSHRSPRPSVDVNTTYMALIVHIPIYEAEHRVTEPAEVTVFVTHTHLITIHKGRVHLLDAFFREVREQDDARERIVGRGAPHLLYSILERLTEDAFPKIDHIAEKISRAERHIFSGDERAMVYELSALRRDLSGFRRIVRPQIHLYDAGTLHGPFATPLWKAVFHSVQGKLARVWDALETLNERISALSETNTNLLTHKLNEFIKLLTLLSAFFIPFGLIAQVVVFLSGDIPIIHLTIFWMIIAGMLTVDLSLLWYWRSRKLL